MRGGLVSRAAAVVVLLTVAAPAFAGKTPGGAPTRLTAEDVGVSHVRLTWRDKSTDETSFEVEGRLGLGPWADQCSVGANVTGCVVQPLIANLRYQFRVKAHCPSGSVLGDTVYVTIR